MSAIGNELLTILATVDRPGDFCVGGLKPAYLPAITVEGVGPIAFPILPAQARQLIAAAESAPYGRGAETLIDRDVRRTWQIGPDHVEIGGRHWQSTLDALAAEAAAALGVTGPVVADFYKLLVYDPGSFFVDHRDTEKAPGMFATLVIVLPSPHEGGALIVRHLGREVVLDGQPSEPSEIGWGAFYADCIHEVRPILSGHRVTLIYNLRFQDGRTAPAAPDHRTERAQISALLRRWPDEIPDFAVIGDDADLDEDGNEIEDFGPPDRLILPLDHAYTQAELSFDALKGRDAAIASVLVEAAADGECDIHLALVSIEESGSAEYDGYGGRWNDDDLTAGEVDDRIMTLSDWRGLDGDAGFGTVGFSEDELCPSDAFEDLTPDEEHFQEATGNGGATFERTYRRAGLILWPRAHRFAIVTRAGRETSLPYLESLARAWEAGGDPAMLTDAAALADLMMQSWPRSPGWPRDQVSNGRMLDLLVRFDHDVGIDRFLDEISARGNYDKADNDAILRAATLLPRPRATALLIRIVAHNLQGHVAACADLVRLCAAADVIDDLPLLAATLVNGLPGDPAKRPQRDSWNPVDPVTPDVAIDLLAGLRGIDPMFGQLAVDHMLTWPKVWQPDAILVPAVLALADRGIDSAAIERLGDVCRDHLRKRIALPLAPPPTWQRANPITCKCDDCRALSAFLVDPATRQWRLKAIQHRRTHVEQEIRRHPCDADLATERRGSPHCLVVTKNQASYERRGAQRAQDLLHQAALGG